MRVGLIADTHGLLRPEALAFLEGSDHIIHAGDIGDVEVLEALEKIAQVTAVRGYNDGGRWAAGLGDTCTVTLAGAQIYVLHDLAELDLDPRERGIAAVVTGHSHKPSLRREDGVLYVNPGSAGPRRFTLPVSVGELTIEGDSVEARLVPLAVKR